MAPKRNNPGPQQVKYSVIGVAEGMKEDKASRGSSYGP